MPGLPPDACPVTLMSKRKKKRSSGPQPGPFSGLYSRQILRAVVDALDLEGDHTLTDRTARRFYQGFSPNAYDRGRIFLASAQTLQDIGIVPNLEQHLSLRAPSAQVYAKSLEFAAEHWDEFMSIIQSESSWDLDMVEAGRLFVGLAAVDLALRICGLNWLTGFDVRLSETPLWVEENGIGRILRVRLLDSGLTREQLAVRLEVSDTTVDNWLDGRHWPRDRYIAPLAREFARGDPGLASPLATQLRREFTLVRLCHLLSERLGRDVVISAVNSLSRFAQDLSNHVGSLFVSENDRRTHAMTLLLRGSDSPLASEMLRVLAAGYPDGEEREIVQLAAVPWELAFGLALKSQGSPKSSAAGLAQDCLEVVDELNLADAVSVRKAITEELGQQVESLIPKGPCLGPEHHPLSIWEDGISRRRRLVERHPGSPEAHYQLGSFLGLVAKHTGTRPLVDEGLLECRIASGLCPAWDAPAVERGIILTNVGAHEEALHELEQVAQELPSPTLHWQFVTGCVLTELERFSEGLELLESVIRARPEYALAYRYAAHCAFRVGNGVKGRDYAKRARRLGDSMEFDAWKRGDYRVRR